MPGVNTNISQYLLFYKTNIDLVQLKDHGSMQTVNQADEVHSNHTSRLVLMSTVNDKTSEITANSDITTIIWIQCVNDKKYREIAGIEGS